MQSSHPTWLEIDRQAVRSNCQAILQEVKTPLMAIVKAEAYGHGAVEVARAALAGGASWLGVARYGEARALRQAGIQAPLLVLGSVTPEEVDQALASQVTLTLHSPESLALFEQRAQAAGQPLRVHLKVDSGLGRLGVFAQDALALARQTKAGGLLVLDGLYSHLAASDEEHPANAAQFGRFQQAIAALEAAGLRPRWVHLANSGAATFLPQTRFDLVRIGNLVLGLRIRVDTELPEYYRPVLSWKARLAACRLLPAGWGVGYGQTYITPVDEWIGVVPVGYGDGLRRVPGNRVLVGGEVCPVVGRLCLDQLMVRLPRAFPPGEPVVIIGQQAGQAIRVHDLARLYQTSQVDVTSLIHSRVPRLSV